MTFNATGTAAAPQTLALVGGSGQTDTIGATLATAYTVAVTDQFGNAVSGVNVTFTVTAGGGAIDGGAGPVIKATDGAGHAGVTRTLGTTAGTQTVQASASVPSGSPVAFNATANPGNATTITANSATLISGSVNAAVSPAPSVKVTDRAGNGVSGVSVSFAPKSPTSGSVTGGTQTSGASGVATVTSWTLDQTVGNDTVLATSGVLSGSPVQFVATSSPGPVDLSASTLIAGSGSITACSISCTTGGGTASTITATIKDQFGNLISGKTVTLSSTGSANAFAPSASGTTSAGGVFSATFSSTAAQTKTISGSVTGSGTLTQTAAVVVNADVVSLGNSLVSATSPITASSGSNTSTVTVTVRDQFSNPISGKTVTIAVSPVTGNSVTQPASLTNASGVTSGSFSSTKAESKTVNASVSGSGTITQTAGVTVNAAAASSIVVNAGNSQSARVGTAVATDPSVLVRDAFLNAVSSASVTFSVVLHALRRCAADPDRQLRVVGVSRLRRDRAQPEHRLDVRVDGERPRQLQQQLQPRAAEQCLEQRPVSTYLGRRDLRLHATRSVDWDRRQPAADHSDVDQQRGVEQLRTVTYPSDLEVVLQPAGPGDTRLQAGVAQREEGVRNDLDAAPGAELESQVEAHQIVALAGNVGDIERAPRRGEIQHGGRDPEPGGTDLPGAQDIDRHGRPRRQQHIVAQRAVHRIVLVSGVADRVAEIQMGAEIAEACGDDAQSASGERAGAQ